MSEVLGDAEPPDNLFDDTYDESDAEEQVGSHPSVGLLSTVASPPALAITSLVLAVISLVGLLSTYLLTSAITVAHPQQSALAGERVNAEVELGLGIIAAILALVAHAAAARADEAPDQRWPRPMAGAAVLLAAISIVQSAGALIIMAGAHAVTGS